jgi:hypothetical protein
MSFHNDIYALLAADVESYFGVVGIPVFSPGAGGTPPDNNVWVDFRFFFNSNASYSLSSEKPIGVSRGFFRFGISGKPGPGVGPLLRVADAAALRFCKGYTIQASTNTFVNDVPSVGSFIEEPDRVIVPITFRFQGTYN